MGLVTTYYDSLHAALDAVEAQNAIRYSDKGMGLGLSITKAVVVAHGGSISAHNNEGKGASFTMRLPVRPPA